jgi:hypothetical protein
MEDREGLWQIVLTEPPLPLGIGIYASPQRAAGFIPAVPRGTAITAESCCRASPENPFRSGQTADPHLSRKERDPAGINPAAR